MQLLPLPAEERSPADELLSLLSEIRILLSAFGFLLVWCFWCSAPQSRTPQTQQLELPLRAAPYFFMVWAIQHQHWLGSCGFFGFLKAKTFLTVRAGLEAVSLGRR